MFKQACLAAGAVVVIGCCPDRSDTDGRAPSALTVARVDRSRFGICSGGFYGDYPREKAAELAAAFRACGFDVAFEVPEKDREMLDAFYANGVGVIVQRGLPYWFGNDGSKAGRMHELFPREMYEKVLAKDTIHPAVVGYAFVDEPSALDFPYIGEIAALIRARRPEMFPCVNLYPNYAVADTNTGKQQASQLGTASYREHVDAYCRNVPLDYVSYDHFTFYDNPDMTRQKSARYYGNMKVVADACRRTDRSFWFNAQACSRRTPNPKFLTQNNLRFQAYSAIAFGCECVWWSDFVQGFWTNNMHQASGERTEMYDKIRLMNAEIRRFEPSFWPYRSFQTEFVGFDADRTALAEYDIVPTDEYSDGFFLHVRAADASRLVVGGMTPKDRANRTRAVLVFGADDIADTFRRTHDVSFRAFGPIRAVGPNGAVKLVSLGGDRYSFKLKDNDCVLLVAEGARDGTSPATSVAQVDRSRFKIGTGGFYGPYPKEKTDELVSDFKACGFSVAGCVRGRDRTMLDALKAQGVGAIVQRGIPYWFGGDGSKGGKMHEIHPREEYEKALASDDPTISHPAIVGYDLVDEPSALDWPYIGEITALIRERRPDKFVYVNLYPNYAVADENTSNQKFSQLGAASYKEYVDAYCRYVPLDYISYDHYTFFDDPEMTRKKSARYYGNMTVVADACRKTDRSFWFIAQACSRKTKNPKFLTENNLRFQLYSALTFGCEAISWANYLQGWWTNNMHQASGERTEMYDKVRRMNEEIRRFEPSFWPYRSFQTEFVGFDADRAALAEYDIVPTDEYSDGFFRHVRAKDGSRLLVGGMTPKDKANRTRAVLVFGADDIADTERKSHVVTFRAFGPVRAVGPNGAVALILSGDDRYSFTLKDNDCALLVVGNPE